MLPSELKEKAHADYLELSNIIAEFKGTLQELCEKLGGFYIQADFESFDLNYKSLTATIYEENGTRYIYEFVDVWDDAQAQCMAEAISYTELFQRSKE